MAFNNEWEEAMDVACQIINNVLVHLPNEEYKRVVPEAYQGQMAFSVLEVLYQIKDECRNPS